MHPVRIVSIVDDDEASRLATASLVRSLGWPTKVFESGEQYLQHLKSLTLPDADETACLISDVKMPRMSGLQLYENLLASGHAPPTIFMTAFATEALCAEVAAHAADGALALLEKPIDAVKLSHYLKQLATVQS